MISDIIYNYIFAGSLFVFFHPFPIFPLSWEGDPDVAVEMHPPKCSEDVCANEPSHLRRCAVLQSGFFSTGAGYCVTWKQL